MVQTINISLPKKLSTTVETIVEKEGYASKSEFIRTLIRLYLHLTAKKDKSFLLPYKKQPIAKVKKSLQTSKQYSKEFIDSVISGLSKSSLYNEN